MTPFGNLLSGVVWRVLNLVTEQRSLGPMSNQRLPSRCAIEYRPPAPEARMLAQ
jgi:hypothetical protein